MGILDLWLTMLVVVTSFLVAIASALHGFILGVFIALMFGIFGTFITIAVISDDND